MAGLGQVRALSVLIPSLTHAYRDLDLEKVRLSAHLPGHEMEHDLLILGGPKNNEAAHRILEAMTEALPFRLHGRAITWEDTAYTGDVTDGEVVRDYGYVVRAPNPLNPAKRVVHRASCARQTSACEPRHRLQTSPELTIPATPDTGPGPAPKPDRTPLLPRTHAEPRTPHGPFRSAHPVAHHGSTSHLMYAIR
ncbi:hypothetical protein ACQUSR_32795 [Streptomyces sp. P1-3]|uniref:hypothetical protein n=1 Tax=Streptomyces sp. P1-3 TaxID=3421658 RepID=UPI003D35EC4D